MFGLAVKTLFEMPISHIGVPGFKSQLHFLLPADAHPGSRQVLAQVVRSLPPT